MNNSILSVTSISKPFFDGQRVLSAALEYGAPIDGSSVGPSSYAVEGRTITNAFVADQPDADAPASSGRYVILSLAKTDRDAKTVKSLHPDRDPGGPNFPGGPIVPGKRMPPPPRDPNFKGPHGLSHKRKPVELNVKQLLDIRASDGTVIPAGESASCTKEINELSDKFTLCNLDGKEYNLYIPDGYDPAKQYPMVLFIGDAGIAGEDARITLEQGNGALCWVTEEEQAKHPCFVLAPAHFDEDPITNDLYECTAQLDRVKAMCDEVVGKYSIDRSRIYTTGQSMGCMSSYELMYRYPDYFAAALCVSGHWTRSKIVEIAKRGQSIWTILSEYDDNGFPCVEEVCEMLDKEGIPYGRYEWDGMLDSEALSTLAREAACDGNTCRFTVYPGDSALRLGTDEENFSGHSAGWYLSYRIEGLRDWLFSNHL